MNTPPAPWIGTSSIDRVPVWWVECSCGWSHPERSTEEDTARMLSQWRQHHHEDHPGAAIVEPPPSALTPFQQCPYCGAIDETCPAAKTERACCECTHPGIEH